MLDSLSTRLQSIFDRLGSRGRLTEDNIQEALREVRVALLEADVNFKVVRAFVDRVREKAIGQDVLKSLTPAQQVVKVVHDELVELLGRQRAPPGHGAASADDHHAGRAAGLGQDHHRGQARPHVRQAGPAPAPGRRRHRTAPPPWTSSRRSARSSACRSSARPGQTPVAICAGGPRRGGDRAASRRSSSTPRAACTSTRRCWTSCRRSSARWGRTTCCSSWTP